MYKRQNYNVAVKESGKEIIFLRTLNKGGSEHSFGIHVARMAGVPKIIVQKASEILSKLESVRRKSTASDKKVSNQDDLQLSFFKLDDPVLEKIRDELLELDINSLTPVEALMKLNDIKKIIGK